MVDMRNHLKDWGYKFIYKRPDNSEIWSKVITENSEDFILSVELDGNGKIGTWHSQKSVRDFAEAIKIYDVLQGFFSLPSVYEVLSKT